MEYFETVRKIIAEQMTVEENEISLETNIVETLGADSLDIAEIAIKIEEELNIDIKDKEANKIKTVNDLVNLLKEKGMSN